MHFATPVNSKVVVFLLTLYKMFGIGLADKLYTKTANEQGESALHAIKN